ncbi:MAG: aminotransferase class V-fold PLP-dependent enzyme [Chlamydiia bacterium]|nr:aminotransferase class V-fold PLP-dependent enzyme [Chlamydiia bacterium]
MDQRSIELDQHTSYLPCQSALERMASYFQTKRLSAADLEAQYQILYDLVGASPTDTFVFTSSAAEAVSQVIWSVFAEVSRKEGKTQWIASCLEDAPTLQMLKRCEELGGAVKIAPVDQQGRLDIEKLQGLITPRTALISVTMAHGLTGVIQPIEELCRLTREKGILLHLDASYALGKTYFSFADSSADYLTFSGERLHGPKASGGLFAKKGRPLVPLILGGSEQGGLRGGPFDIPSFMGLAAAAHLGVLSMNVMGLEVARLRELFETEIVRRVPDAQVLFKDALRLPNTTAIEFPKVHADALLYILQGKGISPNQSGGYCQHLHSVIAAAGLMHYGALSFSLSRMTVQEEVICAAERIAEVVQQLQKVSEDLF